jgi:MerR family transcriptional regulator, light-induced transcriptional regulator
VRNLFSGDHHSRDRRVEALDGHDGKKYVASVAAIAIAKVAERVQERVVIASSEVRVLARLALEADAAVVESFVNNVVLRGVPIEQVYLELLAPTLNLLGDKWSTDELDFSSMTVACCRIRSVMFQLQNASANLVPTQNIASQKIGRIFLAAVPGSQHTFGVQMLADIFRKNCWHVDLNLSLSQRDILKSLNRVDYDVVGFSIGSITLMPELKALTALVKQTRRQSNVRLMVGGPLFSAGVVGNSLDNVDYFSGDALESLEWANTELLKTDKKVAVVA